jgi:hypothetical protein
VEKPPIQYLDRDGARVAYLVVGSGPAEIVYFHEFTFHLDLVWTDPHINHLFERLARRGRASRHARRRGGYRSRGRRGRGDGV